MLLLQSTRVQNDLRWMLGLLGTADLWENNLIIRRWAELPVESEFRVTVVEGTITSIGQYCYQTFIEELALEAEEEGREGRVPLRCIDAIVEVWQEVKSSIPCRSCVVDFAVNGKRAIVVEVNPLDIYTGPLLFHWNADADLICDGQESAHCGIANRICTRESHPGVIFASWEDVIVNHRKNRRKQESIEEAATPLATDSGSCCIA